METPWDALWASFERDLRAMGKHHKPVAENTLRTYGLGGRSMRDWLVAQGFEPDPSIVTKEHVRGWLTSLWQSGMRPYTVRGRWRPVSQFFGWLLSEEELDSNPFAGMSAPAAEEVVPATLNDVEISRMFEATAGSDFQSRRNRAILSVLLDTGIRRTECANMAVEDIDFNESLITLPKIKGRQNPDVAFLGAKAAKDLDRYLRRRDAYLKEHDLDGTFNRGGRMVQALWIGQRGRIGAPRIYGIVQEIGVAAGLGPIHPHQLRHSFAHNLKAQGVSDEDIMTLGRWRDMASMRRYGSSAKLARARDTFRSHSPRDRF